MLTATYSLVAMATEQKNATDFLAGIRQAIAGLCSSLPEIDRTRDLSRVEAALNGIARFDRYCHERKVEKYVIPTVRGASREIDRVVGDLESLSGAGVNLLRLASDQMRALFERRGARVLDLCRAMDAYCDCVQQRLRREDEELLPLLGRMLSVDDWFALAAKFLGDEERRRQGSSQCAVAPGPPAPPH